VGDCGERNSNRVGLEVDSRRDIIRIGGGEHNLHGLRLVILEREINHERPHWRDRELARRATARSVADASLRSRGHAFHHERHDSGRRLGLGGQ